MSQQATQSPKTNHILSVGQELLSGEDVGESLLQSVSDFLALIEPELERVPQDAKKLGEDFLSEHGNLLDELLRYMEGHYDCLVAISELVESEEDYEAVELEEELEALTEATHQLTVARLNYGEAFATFGPSRFPLVNTLQRLLRNSESDPEGEKELLTALPHLSKSLQGVAEQALEQDPGTPDVQEGCRMAVVVLNDVQKNYQDVSAHTKFLDDFTSALFLVETGDEKNFLVMTSQPSRMPMANILINTSRKVLAGDLPEDDLQDALESYILHVAGHWEKIESEIEKPTDSARIKEELPKIMDIVDEHSAVSYTHLTLPTICSV